MSVGTRSLRRLRMASLPTRSFHLATILEDFEQCDFPALNLGTESFPSTPRETLIFEPAMSSLVPSSRTRSWSTLSAEGRRVKQSNTSKADVDRECMICFHLPQRPSRTKCCGKLFCEAHLNDWLAGSSNRCPSCSAYCHPKTDVLSLASPPSPTALSPQSSPGFFRHREHLNGDKPTGRRTGQSSHSRCHSPSPSSSSNSSIDPNTDHDDEDKSVQAKTVDSSSFQSFFVKLIRHFLDDSSLGVPEVSPVDNLQTELKVKSSSHVESPNSELPPSSSGYSSPQSQELQTYSVPSPSNSEVSSDPEMTTVALVGKVIGKVLSIIALMLVFWILSS
ncbi:hypothetical protein GGU10DRAFT_414644 [Lentinula aff. detonsa]|uniref:RING-type domain-containing protein n=1 Tax=Lentinula aff. detonsa TaxID=2804958 RepID=A0AA38NJG7_9AGAR|nr:hypothetical protein GGU10DRAFT_414644 [Lentinula aff. detonsa]